VSLSPFKIRFSHPKDSHESAPDTYSGRHVMPLEAAAVDHIGVASRLSSNMRTLHWVTKIGSLNPSLRFYELVLGLRVLRRADAYAPGPP
jgi:hypothetical protein